MVLDRKTSRVKLLDRKDEASISEVKPSEETERMHRRSAASLENNLNLANVKPMGQKSFNDHLEVCNKLFQENRISSKNAWELHIIDLIKDAASAKSDAGKQMQIATTSLDIGSKIYAIRVDDIHTAGMKLASSMNSKEVVESDKEQDGTLEETGAVKSKKREQRRRAVVKKNTVDKQGSGLFGPLLKLGSVEFSTRDNIELGAIDNLLTIKMPMHPSGHRFLFKERYWIDKRDEALEKTVIKMPLDISKVKKFKICTAFEDFDLLDETTGAGDSSDVSDSVLLDQEGLPIPEMDGSINDIFENHNDFADEPGSDDEENNEQLQVQLFGQISQIVDSRLPEEHVVPNEYGYNAIFRTSTGKVLDRIWAGPSHWRAKFIKRAAEKYTGNVIQPPATQRKRAKVKEELGPMKFNLDFQGIDYDDVVARSKRSVMNVDPEKITLPVPNLRLIDFKFSKGGVRSTPETPEEGSRASLNNISSYAYDNPNDSLYCPQGDGDQDECEENAMAQQNENFLDNLISAPEGVAKSTISYALKAKKMDMKKLKSAVWQNLTNKTPNLKQPETFDGSVESRSFRQLYEEMPKYVSADMKSELTCPLAFVALLHLCNEQNLKCTSKSTTFEDFTIEKAVK